MSPDSLGLTFIFDYDAKGKQIQIVFGERASWGLRES